MEMDLRARRVVPDNHLFLIADFVTSEPQFVGQTPFVDRFEKSRSLVYANFDGRAYDVVGRARWCLTLGMHDCSFLEQEVTASFLNRTQ